MKRNKIFLAVSIVIASAALTESQARSHSPDRYENTSGERFQSMVNRSRGNRGFRRGGWKRRYFRSFRGGGEGGGGGRSSQPREWPTAEADTATTTVDTVTTLDLLANDTGTGLKLKSLYENTKEGGTTSTSNGVVTYTPPSGFTGTDEFWYVVSDADGRTNAASVTIEVGAGNTTDTTDSVFAGVTPEATDAVFAGVTPEATDAVFAGATPEATGAVFTDGTTEITNTGIPDLTGNITDAAITGAINTALPDAGDTQIPEFVFDDTVVTGAATSTSTAGVRCDYAEDVFNDSPSVAVNSTSTWSCNESARNIIANGIPDHAVGTFPSDANANAVVEQTVSESFTLTPTKTETMSTPDVIAYVLNGVKLDATTSGSCNFTGDECSLTDSSGIWSIEALGQTSFDFGSDENNAYVQADGAYRYHGVPEGFLSNQGASDAVMTLIGWAADGFPVYGRHGHSDANDVNSSLKVMVGSYQLAINGDGSRPSTDTYAPGTFTQDWMYFPGSGDLDECNGRTGITPEFPGGIYHYFATDSYPYLPRCLKGQIGETTVKDQVEVDLSETVITPEFAL